MSPVLSVMSMVNLSKVIISIVNLNKVIISKVIISIVTMSHKDNIYQAVIKILANSLIHF